MRRADRLWVVETKGFAGVWRFDLSMRGNVRSTRADGRTRVSDLLAIFNVKPGQLFRLRSYSREASR